MLDYSKSVTNDMHYVITFYNTPVGMFAVTHDCRYIYNTKFVENIAFSVKSSLPTSLSHKNSAPTSRSLSAGSKDQDTGRDPCSLRTSRETSAGELCDNRIDRQTSSISNLAYDDQMVSIISSNITDFCKLIQQTLNDYFKVPFYRFHLPLKPKGSVFQLKVLNALLVIPYGQTTTYGALAKQLNSSPRAIGQACKKNPVPLFIPCHRVIGKHHIGGYMGEKKAIHYKRHLLNHEGLHF